jgi:CRP/FNR family transcriptional regulator
VTAVTDLTLCAFRRQQYEALLGRFAKLELRLFEHANNELAIAQEQMLLLGQKSAIEKIASFLLMTSDRLRRNGQDDNPLWLPMTRQDIGDYLGMTTETASRILSQLQRRGAISKLPDGRVVLVNHQMLERLSEGA